jgi:hypothetical protein
MTFTILHFYKLNHFLMLTINTLSSLECPESYSATNAFFFSWLYFNQSLFLCRWYCFQYSLIIIFQLKCRFLLTFSENDLYAER